ncbi:MAG TPA: hypothetical protein PLH57_09660, partial [Oligoflexia bacterium]|nr:hypothetical protein [Oligoflexia bacterium]
MRPITWSTVIKTLTHLKVKNTARFAFAITLAFGLGSFNISTAQSLKTMEENEVGLDAPVDSESSNRLLPAEEETRPIDAEEFRVQIKKKSTSGRVVLLDDPTENRPKPGKILLLKNGKENVV